MNGFVYAATGDIGYTQLAIRSARSLKAQCPDYPIDLFTDQPCDDDVFDQVHVYEDSWFRAKIDALQDSRFEKTVYIDADTFVIDDISDVFFILDRFDIATTQDQGRNSEHCQEAINIEFPQSFPTLNSGLVAINKRPEIIALLQAWRDGLKQSGTRKDQPLLRELLWQSELHLAILPPEYNLMHLHWLDAINYRQGIPKVIHSPRMHRHFKNKGAKITGLYQLLGAARLYRLLKNRRTVDFCTLKDIPDEVLFGDESLYSWPDKLRITFIKRRYRR
jgi:hypothetical protein